VLQAALSKVGVTRARTSALVAGALAVSLVLAACGSDSSSSDGSTSGDGGGSRLIVAAVSFPCSLNDFAKSLCEGFEAGEAALPEGYEFQLKLGTDFADTNAFNNIIETSSQLNPGGIIVFPNGPAAQTPVLKQACARDIRIMIIDNPVTGLGDCQDAYIAANHRELGEQVGRWLLDHPPASREVGIVTFPFGQAQSNDDRVNGFREAVEAAGYRVVAYAQTDLTLDRTRTQVTNMLTAHPNLGAIFSANDQMGYGTAQAVRASGKDVKQLTIDGALDAVRRIPEGLAVDAAQSPYYAGKQSILNMVKLLEGKSVPAIDYEPSQLVDETNVDDYIAAGGLR
jgi:ABC-type sugar transport system substrate-binding protein